MPVLFILESMGFNHLAHQPSPFKTKLKEGGSDATKILRKMIFKTIKSKIENIGE